MDNDKLNEELISLSEIQYYEWLKRRIINLWLPLAIDIQGLKDFAKKENLTIISEIESNQSFNNYYEKIKKDVKIYKEEVLREWNKIKISIVNYDEKIKRDVKIYKEEVLEEWHKIKISIGDNQLPEEVIAKITDDSTISVFYEEYLSNRKRFLPNWLQEVVGILDNMIIKQTG